MGDSQPEETQNPAPAVNQEYLKSLLEMGIPEDIAIQVSLKLYPLNSTGCRCRLIKLA